MVIAVYFTAKIGKLLDKWEIEETFFCKTVFFRDVACGGKPGGPFILITIKRCIFDVGNVAF